jgi:hypothetical protein
MVWRSCWECLVASFERKDNRHDEWCICINRSLGWFGYFCICGVAFAGVVVFSSC